MLVLVVGCGETDRQPSVGDRGRQAVTTPSVAQRVSAYGNGTQRYRLARPPLVISAVSSDPLVFQVRLRFNRELPHRSGGASLDVVLGDDATGDIPPQRYGRRARHCYVDVIIDDYADHALRGARVGSRVPLLVRVRTGTVFRGMATLQPRSRVGALHCGR